MAPTTRASSKKKATGEFSVTKTKKDDAKKKKKKSGKSSTTTKTKKGDADNKSGAGRRDNNNKTATTTGRRDNNRAAAAAADTGNTGNDVEYRPMLTRNAYSSGDEEPDWTSIFPVRDAYSSLSPRMAFRLHEEAVVLSDETWMLSLPSYVLSDLAKYHYKSSKTWNKKLVACFERIAMRLQKGRLPIPNCVGEAVALRAIIKKCQGEAAMYLDSDERYEAVASDETARKLDDNFLHVVNKCLDSDDMVILKILFDVDDDEDSLLFEEGDDFCVSDDSSSEEDDESSNYYYSDDNDMQDRERDTLGPILGYQTYLANKFEKNARKFSAVIQGRGKEAEIKYAKRQMRQFQQGSLPPDNNNASKLLNLHPNRWFFAFREDDIENHL